MIVYKIKNRITKKCYVGVTAYKLTQRIGVHISHVNKGSGYAIHNAIRKYDIESFKITVIDTATDRKTLFEKERYWIKRLDSISPNGYNLTAGGDGLRATEEVRRTISRKAKKRGVSKQFIKAGCATRFGNIPAWNKGKKLSAEHRENLSKSHMGNKHSAETKHKMSSAQKGHPNRNWRNMKHDALGRFVVLTERVQ